MTAPLAASADSVTSAPVIEKRPLQDYVAPDKLSLVGMTRDGLAAALGGIGVPERQQRMRVQQIWHWLYVRGAQDFDAMTTLSKDLRAALAQKFTLARPDIAAEQTSVDGTRKWLLHLPGEIDSQPHDVECVHIPETARGQIAHQALGAGVAERAVERAAHLTGNAQRAAVGFRDMDALDVVGLAVDLARQA